MAIKKGKESHMIKGIIFDFNGTLYLPEQRAIPTEVLALLTELKKRGIHLGLITMFEHGRKNKINKVAHFFDVIEEVPRKRPDIFIDVLKRMGLEKQDVLIVGDNPFSEIRCANVLGIKSLLLRKANTPPDFSYSEFDTPTHIIGDLDEVLRFV